MLTTSSKAIELVWHSSSTKRLFCFWMEFIASFTNFFYGGHIIKIRSCTLIRRHFAKFVCICVHNPNFFVKFQKFIDLLDIKGNKLFWNVKIRRTSMLSLVKHVYAKYYLVIVKMHACFKCKKWGCFKELECIMWY